MKILTILGLILLHSGEMKLETIPSDIPLHPFFVHFPVVLTFITPFIIFLFIQLENKNNYNVWKYIIIYNIFILVMTYFSLSSGDVEHEILENSPYIKQTIEQHERFAQISFLIQIIMVAVAFLGMQKFNFYKSMRWIYLIISIIAIPIVGFTGKLGGKIVHELESPKYRKIIVEEFKKEIECKKEPSKCEIKEEEEEHK